VNNYYNYFTEIESHFQKRRGSLLLLSTLDWALIETWIEAGIPLEAVLRGIDNTFEKYEARKSRGNIRRINGLAYCSQAVMEAVEEMKEAAIGARTEKEESSSSGFEQERVANHLESCSKTLRESGLQHPILEEIAQRMVEVAAEVRKAEPKLEELERNLTVLEEKLFAALTTAIPEADMVVMKESVSKDIAQYRSRMQAAQIRQIEQQFLHKKMLERYKLPRLSLFYMSMG
jgi:hypothetical protein